MPLLRIPSVKTDSLGKLKYPRHVSTGEKVLRFDPEFTQILGPSSGGEFEGPGRAMGDCERSEGPPSGSLRARHGSKSTCN